MTADKFSYLILILLAMHVTFFAISGIVLMLKNKEQHDRSRLIFSLICFTYAFSASGFIFSALKHDSPTEFMDLLLDPFPVVYVLLFFVLIPAYVIEVLRPNWLRFSHAILYLSPWIVTCLVFLGWYGVQGWTLAVFTPLHSCQDIWLNIHRPDVIFRLIFASFYLPYAFSIFFVSYDPHTSNVSIRLKRVLQCLVVLTAIGFIVGVQLRITGMIFFYWIVVDTMIGIVLYLEFSIRIPVPVAAKPVSEPKAAENDASPKQLSDLAVKLQVLLEHDIWQNPDIHRELVCQTLATNRTYLSNAIRELGYDNFADMINMRRMLYVEQQLAQNPNAVITDLLFQAGYRNRTSAIRYFTMHFGVSPAEYIKVLHNQV